MATVISNIKEYCYDPNFQLKYNFGTTKTCNHGVILASGHSSNCLQALNQESARNFGTGMCGLETGGNQANRNNDNFGEGTNAKQRVLVRWRTY